MLKAKPNRHLVFLGIPLPFLCGAIALMLASVILITWIGGLDANEQLFRVFMQMKANTALCLSLLGLALAIAGGRGYVRARVFIILLVSPSFVVALITLIEYLLGWESGIDILISSDIRNPSHPGRMAPLTTVSIIFLSLALLAQLDTRRVWIRVSQTLSLVAIALATVTLLGHLYGASPFLHLFGLLPMAKSTAVLVLLVGFGTLMLHPEAGPVAPLFSSTISARMGRRLLVLVCITLPSLAWLRMQGQAMQLYSAEFGTALVIATSLIMMSALIITHTANSNHAEIRLRYLNRVYGVLSEVNSLIVRAATQEELFAEAHRIAIERGAFPRAWLGLVNADRTAVVLVAGAETADLPPKHLDARLSLRLDSTRRSPIARAVTSGLPVVSNDVAADYHDPFQTEMLAHNIYSFAVFPLVLKGEVIGIFKLHAEVPNFFHDEELRLLSELAGDITFAIHHLEQKKLLDYLAYFDSLTGLANSRLFEERVGQAISHCNIQEISLAVVVADVVAFKVVNEAFGRQVGDEALKEVARRLSAVCGSTNNSRLGSNLFAIQLMGINNDGGFVREIERITESCFARRFEILGNSFTLSARAGIAFLGRDGNDAKSLLNNAEAALSTARATGQRYCFHDFHSNERNKERLALQTALAHAIETGEFRLHYQVKVYSKNFEVCGAEALLRWHSFSLGAVEPSRFVPLLEEAGLIERVGKWALQQASLDNSQLISPVMPGFRIAVNVSSAQLLRHDFVDTVVSSLGKYATMADIDLELTESLIMTDIEASIDKLRHLRGLGIKIAIDDFGTGYSSMAYLAKLPVDYLKIDRSFVTGLPSSQESIAVISSIISLGHALGLQVIAEGIEHHAQAELLASLGCDQLQGYLFGKPTPLSDLIDKIMSHRTSVSIE